MGNVISLERVEDIAGEDRGTPERKTYGRLEYSETRRKWVMEDIPPHVAIRLKAVFPRISLTKTRDFTFPNDLPHCADLAWFLERYPMDMSDADARRLRRGRDDFEQEQRDLEEILLPSFSPDETLPGLREGQKGRPYQLQAAELLKRKKSLLLGDVVGLGKTYSAILSILATEAVPAAVVVQAHLVRQWKEKIEAFSDLTVHIIRKGRPYDLPKADVYVFSYGKIGGWTSIFAEKFFRIAIYDEIHDLRRGTESVKGQAARVLSRNVDYRLGLSATPILNYGIEMHNIMLFIDDRLLGTREEFIREWCDSRAQLVKDPDALGSYLREQHAFLRRTKEDVGQYMDPVNHVVETVPSDPKAIQSVQDLARTLAIKVQEGSFIERGQAARELDLLMRQATGVGKAHAVANYAKLFLDNKVPIILAAWHRDVYDIYLDVLKDYNPLMYTGSESQAQKERNKKAFMEGESDLLIMSLRSGSGLDGVQYRCSTVVIGELDWSPKVHEQLIGRVFRDGQTESVMVLYLVSEDGSDPLLIDMLGIKENQSRGILDPNSIQQPVHSDDSRMKALAELVLKRAA